MTTRFRFLVVVRRSAVGAAQPWSNSLSGHRQFRRLCLREERLSTVSTELLSSHALSFRHVALLAQQSSATSIVHSTRSRHPSYSPSTRTRSTTGADIIGRRGHDDHSTVSDRSTTPQALVDHDRLVGEHDRRTIHHHAAPTIGDAQGLHRASGRNGRCLSSHPSCQSEHFQHQSTAT